MIGAHRSTTQNPVTAGLRSAAWLMALASLITVPLALLALLALGIYVAIARQADLLPFVIALQSVACMLVFGNLAWRVLRKPRPSPEGLVHLMAQAGVLLCLVTGLLADIGRQRGWMHGAYQDAVTGISGLFVLGIPAYWLGGKRLTAALRAWNASRQRRK